MTLEEYAKFQLEHVYRLLSQDEGIRISIKNWCTVVWVGSLSLLAVVRGQSLPTRQLLQWAAFLPLAIVVVFWLLDATYQGFINVHHRHAKSLERMLVGKSGLRVEALLQASVCTGMTILAKQEDRTEWERFETAFLHRSLVRLYGPLCAISMVAMLLVLRSPPSATHHPPHHPHLLVTSAR